jgi:hypothetical protein
MSATIGNFYDRVSRAIRRGNVYDDDIPGYAADAVRELENIENWKYMWREARGTLVEGDAHFEIEDLKSIRYIVLVFTSSNGETYTPLRKVKREQVISRANPGRPGAWWTQTIDGSTTTLAFDAFADQDYSIGVGEFKYSANPLVDSLAWLTIGEDLLIARTIRKMQPILRDDKLVSRWREIEDSAMPALLEKELVAEYDGIDNVVVPFAEEMEEELANSIEW